MALDWPPTNSVDPGRSATWPDQGPGRRPPDGPPGPPRSTSPASSQRGGSVRSSRPESVIRMQPFPTSRARAPHRGQAITAAVARLPCTAGPAHRPGRCILILVHLATPVRNELDGTPARDGNNQPILFTVHFLPHGWTMGEIRNGPLPATRKWTQGNRNAARRGGAARSPPHREAAARGIQGGGQRPGLGRSWMCPHPPRPPGPPIAPACPSGGACGLRRWPSPTTPACSTRGGGVQRRGGRRMPNGVGGPDHTPGRDGQAGGRRGDTTRPVGTRPRPCGGDRRTKSAGSPALTPHRGRRPSARRVFAPVRGQVPGYFSAGDPGPDRGHGPAGSTRGGPGKFGVPSGPLRGVRRLGRGVRRRMFLPPRFRRRGRSPGGDPSGSGTEDQLIKEDLPGPGGGVGA